MLIILTTGVKAQEFTVGTPADNSVDNYSDNPDDSLGWLDSVDISLLTCGPGSEVWSLYGHTALRIDDRAHGQDLAVNWGIFSFGQDYFVLRFVFGLTDYQMGIFPMTDFLAEYSAQGRWVKQQRIRLTRDEKLRLLRAVDKNNRPENRTYRYNYFYDNCTTRARDMVLDQIGPSNVRLPQDTPHSTYRREIHALNEHHRWARFGNDLLLGAAADRDICRSQWEFLPGNLSSDFDITARKDIVTDRLSPTSKRGKVALVDSACWLIAPQVEVAADEPVTPRLVFALIGTVIVAVSALEFFRRKNFWWVDTLLMLLTGLPGLILLAMIFSQHPTVQINCQLLLLCPLHLCYVWRTSKRLRQGRTYWYCDLWALLLLLALVLQIWQTYAEGMGILALSLFIRRCIKFTQHELKKKTSDGK